MATPSFGRRGAVLPAPRSTVRPATASQGPAAAAAATSRFDPAPAAAEDDWTLHDNKLIADIPVLTAGLIVFLILVFAIERRLTIDLSKKDGTLDIRSLIAFGAVSRDLVVGHAEWWRLGLGPLLHGSTSHVMSNCFALFFVGIRLEPMIGRGWFALIFVAAALGGDALSLMGNAPGVPGVGASGAICGLIGTLFVASFNPYADRDQRRTMRRTALFFGVPALLPLMYTASGPVDYFAHGGGALAGAVIGVVLWLIWPHDSRRPHHARVAGLVALAGLAGAALCAGFAANRYAGYMADAAQFIRISEFPEDMKVSAQSSADLIARYPNDPRAHLIRAVFFLDQHRLGEAEARLRTAVSLAAADVAGGPVRTHAQAVLAVVLLAQNRRTEAKALAADACGAKDPDRIRQAMTKAKLCE